MIRWYLDLAIVQTRIVGKVWQAATNEQVGPGQVRASGKWQAVGMVAAWCDTNLGAEFEKRADAMEAVATWWKEIQK